WPAFKSVAPRDHKLRMVQREFCRIRAAIAPIHFGDGGWITGAEIAQQFLRLAFQLFEIRMLAHPPGRQVRFHMSSFPLRPVSALLGQKRVHLTQVQKRLFIRRTQSFPRTRRRPESAMAMIAPPLGPARDTTCTLPNRAFALTRCIL